MQIKRLEREGDWETLELCVACADAIRECRGRFQADYPEAVRAVDAEPICEPIKVTMPRSRVPQLIGELEVHIGAPVAPIAANVREARLQADLLSMRRHCEVLAQALRNIAEGGVPERSADAVFNTLGIAITVADEVRHVSEPATAAAWAERSGRSGGAREVEGVAHAAASEITRAAERLRRHIQL